MTVSHLIQT